MACKEKYQPDFISTWYSVAGTVNVSEQISCASKVERVLRDILSPPISFICTEMYKGKTNQEAMCILF